MQNIIKIIMLLAIIDFIGMLLWMFSGQTPIDGAYVGRISTEIIKLII